MRFSELRKGDVRKGDGFIYCLTPFNVRGVQRHADHHQLPAIHLVLCDAGG